MPLVVELVACRETISRRPRIFFQCPSATLRGGRTAKDRTDNRIDDSSRRNTCNLGNATIELYKLADVTSTPARSCERQRSCDAFGTRCAWCNNRFIRTGNLPRQCSVRRCVCEILGDCTRDYSGGSEPCNRGSRADIRTVND